MRAVFLLTVAICLLSAEPEVADQTVGKTVTFDYRSQIGVASVTSENQLCLGISNPNLHPGERLTLVNAGKRQSIIKAKVRQKTDKPCSAGDVGDEEVHYYLLEVVSSQVEPGTLAVGITGTKAVFKVSRGIVSADLDSDGKSEYFRECASTEGIHLTVWSGGYPEGWRQWHRYFYLGYDVEPNCTAREAGE